MFNLRLAQEELLSHLLFLTNSGCRIPLEVEQDAALYGVATVQMDGETQTLVIDPAFETQWHELQFEAELAMHEDASDRSPN